MTSKKIPYGKISSIAQLGLLVRRHRKEAGVQQADAAALAGVGTRFLSELERGKETAEVGKVLQVLERLGLELSIVPRGSGPAEPGSGPAEPGSGPAEHSGTPAERESAPTERGSEPAKRHSEPAKRHGAPTERRGEPAERRGEPAGSADG